MLSDNDPIPYGNDLNILIQDSLRNEANAERIKDLKGALTFIFNLSGRLRCRLPDDRRLYEVGPDESQLLYFPEESPCFEDLADERVHRVWIGIGRQRLCRHYHHDCPFLPRELHRILHEDEREPFVSGHPLSPSMKTAVHQISDCPFHAPHLSLFQESKALELIAWHLEIMSSRLCQTQNGCACCRLRPEDIRRIRAAREILINDFEAPPCLKILAARVGLNATKLKRGFRQVYGDSVFAYLRSYRMEIARSLLEKGEMNVTEAAMAVGYTNIGHFCAVFKKHFGINPGCCLRQTGFFE